MEERQIKRGYVIAIDGPAGAGKSTLSRLLATELGFTYIDTGAMYRAIALKAYQQDINIEDGNALRIFCSSVNVCFTPPPASPRKGGRKKVGGNRIFIDGKDYSEDIRTQFVGELSSNISSKKEIRDAMAALQRSLSNEGSVVMEGRDIGTVVFPDADIKFYIDAQPIVRAKRRYTELKEKGHNDSLDKIVAEIKERDQMDSTRMHAPLKKADDAIYIDTSEIELKEVLSIMLKIIKERLFIGSA